MLFVGRAAYVPVQLDAAVEVCELRQLEVDPALWVCNLMAYCPAVVVLLSQELVVLQVLEQILDWCFSECGCR